MSEVSKEEREQYRSSLPSMPMYEAEVLERLLDALDTADQRIAELEAADQREHKHRRQLNHIEAYCSDYVDDISISHQAMRGICEIIGMEWRGNNR